MKIEWDKRYTTIAVYAVIVIGAGLLFAALLINFSHIWDFITETVGILLPFSFGIAMAYLLSPLLRVMEKKALANIKNHVLRRKIGISITYFVTITILVLGGWYISPRIAESITVIYNTIPSYLNTLEGWAGELNRFFPEGVLPEDIAEMLENVTNTIFVALQNLLPQALDIISRFTSGLMSFALGIIISIYLLYHKEKFFAQSKKIMYAFLPDKTVEVIISITRDGNKKISSFITGKILDSLIMGMLCFIGMTIFGMPYALLVSVIVGITNIIPYFGPFIGAIPSFLFILTADPTKALWFALFILALQQFDGNILGPYILGDSTGLSAFWVIFAIMFFGGQFGVLGMVLGVPIFAVIYTAFKGLIEYRLWKKGKPLETSEYTSEKHPLIK